MLFYKNQSFWSFNHHEWTNIPNSHHKRHCIKINTCWDVTTIRQLNRPPEVNITLIIQNLVLFFHWMQPNTPNFMQYFSAKTKIISLSFTLCLTHVCNFVENVFWKAKLQTDLFPAIFNLLNKTPKLHRQQGPMIQSRAKIPRFHLVFYGKSSVETDLTYCGKNLAEPVKALSMTSSEQWHTYR